MTRASILLVVLAASVGCTARGSAPPAPASDPALLQPPVAALLSDAGQLQVFTSNVLSDGRRMRVRGFVHNPYPERVDGVRLALRLLSYADRKATELERFQRVVEGPVEPGQDVPVHWDVESGYGGVAGGGFDLQAFAIRRGDSALRPPPGWRP